MSAYPHYFRALPPGCTHVDVYRVLELFGVVDPPIQHAVKKLLCAGERGNKTMHQDIAEAIATLQRWQQMRLEEAAPAIDFDISNTPDVWTSQPAPAPEDAERAAYLERWKDAPEWAEWLAEYPNALGRWFEVKPTQDIDGLWVVLQSPAGKDAFAGYNLLGSVRCEPRPTPAGGQGVEG